MNGANGRWMRNSFIYLLILIAVMAIFFAYFQPSGGQKEVDLGTVIAWAKAGEVYKIEVRGDDLTVYRGGTTYRARKEEGMSLVDLLVREGVSLGPGGVEVVVKGGGGLGNVLGIVLQFLPIIFLGALLLFMMRQAQGSSSQTLNFGRSRARLFLGNRPTVTFADVAGVDEAKQELQEVVEFLKYPERFAALGARVPKGVLLVGPPGTGKTLLARAVAGEAGVPFFSVSGSEFVEMFVGVGAARVRDLFDQAKRNAPCIVFIDEIDAVGRHRGAGLGGGHDEREQTLNQILVEMDGFDASTNVIVIAATNRPDILDPALLRPGRFDRRVVLDLPDLRGRYDILKVHTRGKPLEPDVDLMAIAKQTPGFSGADLANLVNEAAILAARRNKRTIGRQEFAEAIDRVIAGPERKSRVLTPREKALVAYHEAGHALVARHMPHADPVHKISIVARGAMGGYTRMVPQEDRFLWTREQFLAMLAVAMGGRVAEELAFGEVTTGASNDLEQATRVARQMVTRYGMSEPATYPEAPIGQVLQDILEGRVEVVEVYGQDLLVRMKDGRVVRSRKEVEFSLVEFLDEERHRREREGRPVDLPPIYVKSATMLGGLGPRTFGKREELVFLGKEITEQRDYSDKVAERIDEEVERLIQWAYEKAREILTQHRAKLDQIAQYLIRHETVEGEELERLFSADPAAPLEEEPSAGGEAVIPSPAPAPPPQPGKVRGPSARPGPAPAS